MDIFVELFRPQAHPGPIIRMLGCKRRIGIGLIEVLKNDIRFRNDPLAVDKRRYHRAAIELTVPGLLVLSSTQHEMSAFPFQALLGKPLSLFLGTERLALLKAHKHGSPFRRRRYSPRIRGSTRRRRRAGPGWRARRADQTGGLLRRLGASPPQRAKDPHRRDSVRR